MPRHSCSGHSDGAEFRSDRRRGNGLAYRHGARARRPHGAGGLEKFKAEVEAATGGDVVIEVFHRSQQGDSTEMLDQARAGANVGTVTDVARLSSFVPSLAIMSAPFLFNTFKDADRFTGSEAYLAWGKELRDKAGIAMLASNWYQGARHALNAKTGLIPG